MNTSSTTSRTPIKVLLVDDSAVVRGLMARALKAHPDIEVVATAADGKMAIDALEHHAVDIIILDIEMPVMDGITALPLLLKRAPKAHIIMASTLTHRNAEISMKALRLGAADYLPKPSSVADDKSAVDSFYRELIGKICALAPHHIDANRVMDVAPLPSETTNYQEVPVVSSASSMPKASAANIDIHALAIASSTGGPQALQRLLLAARQQLNHIPVFITQHMPATFTKLLAEHLSRDTGCVCVEAEHDDIVRPGIVYVAPGDFHMTIERSAGVNVIKLNQEPPVNFCRPAADPMLFSLAPLYKDKLLLAVMTGMGSDGLEGAKTVLDYAGQVIVQDKESSVVWGMPGAIVKAGLVQESYTPEAMAGYIQKSMGGAHHAGG